MADNLRHKYCEFVRVIVHHGFTDLIEAFVYEKILDGNGKPVVNKVDKFTYFIVPNWKPSSSHRLSDDNVINTWLWLIKGDGDIDDKMVELIEKSRLFVSAEIADEFVTLVGGAYRSGAKVTSEQLIRNPGYTSQIDDMLLVRAAFLNDIDAVKCLVEGGADVQAVNRSGESALHATNCPNIARYLVDEHFASVHALDNKGCTPLIGAEDLNLVKFLVEDGADVNARSHTQNTALHWASSRDVVKYLIEKNADVNAIGENGETPLHKMLSGNVHLDVIKYMVKEGKADVHIAGRNGKTVKELGMASNKYKSYFRTL
jgi:hypothetical protein